METKKIPSFATFHSKISDFFTSLLDLRIFETEKGQKKNIPIFGTDFQISFKNNI